MNQKQKQFKVDFIGIGAEKAGTSWIAQCLKEHPQICFSKQKEIRFFDKNYHKGLDFYKSFFNHCQESKIKGEYTPRNFVRPWTAKRIKRYFSDVKLIICFRDPIERACSHYYHDLSLDRVPGNLSFERVLKKYPKYIQEGKYYSYLKLWFELYPFENFLFLIYEDIKKNPLKFIQKVYRFLEVDDKFIPKSLNFRVNPVSGKKFKFLWLNRAINKIFNFKNRLGKYRLGRRLMILCKKMGLNRLVLLIFRKNIVQKPEKIKKTPFPKSVQASLRKIYYPEVKNLEKVINRELSEWLK